MILPDAWQGIQALLAATEKGAVPEATLGLVHLRASQINGCSACVDSGSRGAKKAGESDERLFAVAAWREAPYFSEAERAAAGFSAHGAGPGAPCAGSGSSSALPSLSSRAHPAAA